MTDMGGAQAIKAIETRYAGRRFRSRLEARWAVFFDTLYLPYDYEKEGYALESGPYLPDFWLPKLDCWIEIKGDEPTQLENALASDLACASGKEVFMFVGSIKAPSEGNWFEPVEALYFAPGERERHLPLERKGSSDIHYMWCECRYCGALGIKYEGRSARLPCRRKNGPCAEDFYNDRDHNVDSSRLLAAYAAALSARFEFGEEG